MPGRGAGLLTNAESSPTISCCRSSSHPGVGRRVLERAGFTSSRPLQT